MNFDFRRFDSPRQRNPLFPTSSLSSVSRHAFFSDLPVTEVATRAAIEVEIAKERMRSEIITEEIRRQCVRRDMIMERDTMVGHNNGGLASSYMLGQPGPPPFSSHHNRFEHETNMHGRLFSHEDIRRMMSPHEIHGIGGTEMVPYHRGPESSIIKMIPTYQPKHEEIVSLGQPFGAPVSSLKRKLPPLPSPADERSSRLCLETLNKKMIDERRYALNGSKNSGEFGPGNIKRSVSNRKLKPWCSLCQIETSNEKCMIEHKKGKKHRENLLKLARA